MKYPFWKLYCGTGEAESPDFSAVLHDKHKHGSAKGKQMNFERGEKVSMEYFQSWTKILKVRSFGLE
jgi:hypothetical protein